MPMPQAIQPQSQGRASSMATAVSVATERSLVARRPWRRESGFYTGMALLCAAVVATGFAPTYYLKGAFGGRPLSLLLHVHGLIFTSWIALFVVQTTLVASHRTGIHRRLGLLGGVIAGLMLVAGFFAAVDSARRGFTPAGGPPPLVFLAIPLFMLVVFAALVGAALYYRRQSATHKRLMLLATISIITPAIARIPLFSGGPAVFFGITDLVIVACLVYDKIVNGRVHRAFALGALFVIVSQPLRILIGFSGPWQAFAGWLTR
jgi:hypothetical protein